jgi:dTMP kinase
MNKGKLIVIDGGDGSGKSTQVDLLMNRLKTEGKQVAKIDFPRYSQPSAWFVESYLKGQFGSLEEIGPYQASVFYALDRFAIKKDIQQMLASDKLIIANRYVSANMGHQGAKIKDKEERKLFFKWLYDFEFNILGIPKPDATLILHVPAVVAQGLVDKKGHRDYIGGVKRDLHESDLEHLQMAEKVFLEIARDFSEFYIVECYEAGQLLTKLEINNKIYHILNKII